MKSEEFGRIAEGSSTDGAFILLSSLLSLLFLRFFSLLLNNPYLCRRNTYYLMPTLTLLLLILVALLYLKWVLIFVSIPLMAMAVPHKQRRWGDPLWVKGLAVPNRLLEKLTHNGWQRYVLFQVGTLPSLHVRKAIYRLLGAQIGPCATFHFRTEIRAPHYLFVGGGGDNR